jgi:hypothetical protein
MTNTAELAPWESFVTPKMEADARRQATKLVNSGMTIDAAAAEATAWVRMKAIQARMLSNIKR